MIKVCEWCGSLNRGPRYIFCSDECFNHAQGRRTAHQSGKHYKPGGRKKTVREKNRTLMRDAKRAPCIDCGQIYPYYVMDFDHVRGAKVANISRMVSRPLNAVIEEMEKCDVVCSNCHRERTFGRRVTTVHPYSTQAA